MCDNIRTLAQIDRLINAAALGDGVKIPDFNHSAHFGNRVIGRNGYVPGWMPVFAIQEPDFTLR
jgi:hypothetical protein